MHPRHGAGGIGEMFYRVHHDNGIEGRIRKLGRI